jgi:cytochrome c2
MDAGSTAYSPQELFAPAAFYRVCREVPAASPEAFQDRLSTWPRSAARSALVLFLAAIGIVAALPESVQAEESMGACLMCHQVGEGAKNGVGPTLNGVYGERVGSRSGFVYSPAMSLAGQRGKIWDEQTLDAYLADPRGSMPGTRMAYGGVKDPETREAIIAFIKQFED